MSSEAGPAAGEARSNVWVTVSVLACLGLGVAATYWLMNGGPAEAEVGRAAPVQGRLLRAPATKTPATPATVQSANPAPVPVPAPGDSEYTTVTFDTLAGFFYLAPDADGLPSEASAGRKNQIPAPIRAFNGKKIAVQGFMMPLKVEKGGCKAFLLVRDQGICCFRRTPRMNEWISVSMKGEQTARLITDQPITIFGTLSVGELIENGTVTSVYRLVADELSGPLDLGPPCGGIEMPASPARKYR